MTISSNSATAGQKEIKTKWPITSGLTAGTTKQKGRQINLKAKKGSLIPKRKKAGLD